MLGGFVVVFLLIGGFGPQILRIDQEFRTDLVDVLQCLTDLFATHGPPEHLRSDNVLRRETGL